MARALIDEDGNPFNIPDINTFVDLIQGKNVATLAVHKDEMAFLGVDTDALFRKAYGNYSSSGVSEPTKDEFGKILSRLAAYTFYRGCNLNNVLQKWRDETRKSEYLDYIKSLGVVSIVRNKKDDLSLGRIALLVPHVHPHLAGRGLRDSFLMCNALPLHAHCGSFAACVPAGDDWDGAFYMSAIFNIHYDTIINANKRGRRTTVRQIVQYMDAGRKSIKVLSNEKKIKLMALWGIGSGSGMWAVQVVNGVLDLDSSMAWNQIGPGVMNLPAFASMANVEFV